MDGLDAEMSKIQTAIWMSDKLARLCREYIKAKKEADSDEMCRLGNEMNQLVHSQDFSDAVELIGSDLFYPDILRKIREMLKNEKAGSVSEAVKMLALHPNHSGA